jgi:hypothetical protein
MRRVVKNDVWHFWGKTTKFGTNAKLTTNNFFHVKCLYHLSAFYKNLFKISDVIVVTDGCQAQYKSRRAYWSLKKFQVDEDYDSAIQSFVPTACFKSIVDGAGEDAKTQQREFEQAEMEGTRGYDARSVFNSLRRNMQQPFPKNPVTCPSWAFDKRFHRLLVDVSDEQDGDRSSDDIIVVDSTTQYWDCKPISGSFSASQIRASKFDANTEINMRNLGCYCDSCMSKQYNLCQHKDTTGDWNKVIMTSIPYQPNPPKQPSEHDMSQFFTGAIQVDTPVFIATLLANDIGLLREQVRLAVLFVAPKKTKQSLQVNLNNIDDGSEARGLVYIIPRNTWYIGVKYLTCVDAVRNIYCLLDVDRNGPVQNYPLKSIIFLKTIEQDGPTKNNYIQTITDPTQLRDIQAEVMIDLTAPDTYVIHPDSIEWICDNASDSDDYINVAEG